MSWIFAGVASAGLTLAAVKWVSGNSKEKKAKKAREALKAPFYDIQNEYYHNVNAANSMAQSGLPAATKDFYTNQSERGLSTGVEGILGSGGTPNDISKLFQTYNDGIGKLSSVDAETHLNNIKYYMGVNKDLAGQKTIQWAINKQQPYLNTLKELSAAQRAGEATKNEAYGDAMSSLTSFGTSMAGGKGFGGGTGKTTNTGELITSGSSRLARGNKEAWGDGSSTDKFDIRAMGDSFQPGYVNTNLSQINSDPFSNNEDDYAKYQQWLKYQEQQGERKGGW